MVVIDRPPSGATASSDFPTSTAIQRLVLATDLAALAARYTPLYPTGIDSVLRGNCPLHSDDSRLLFVLQSETFRCLSCGAHGNALDFVMHVEHADESRALRRIRQFLEARAAADQARQIDPAALRALIDVHAQAAKFYAGQLSASAEAIRYLKRRGVADETAAYWNLGYAPDSWHGIQDALKEYPIGLLVDAGLLIHREGMENYDRFRGRLTFPIRGASEETVAFGGRALRPGEPKYLNSPETLIFQKGRMLYGQYESGLVDRSIDRLWVVEGYMDVVTLWQNGIRNCVATLGTSTTTEHLVQLFRMTQEVLFCFDGDDAGRSAAWRALERTLPALRKGRRVGFLVPPQGEDPDSLVRKEGIHTLYALADQAQSLPVFLTRELGAIYDTSHADGRARYLARATALLARVIDRDWRFELSTEIAEQARVAAGTSRSRTIATGCHQPRDVWSARTRRGEIRATPTGMVVNTYEAGNYVSTAGPGSGSC